MIRVLLPTARPKKSRCEKEKDQEWQPPRIHRPEHSLISRARGRLFTDLLPMPGTQGQAHVSVPPLVQVFPR